MAKGQDLRPQATKATISWNPGWMGLRDRLGDRVGEWAEQGDFKNFRCRWCKKVRSGFQTKFNHGQTRHSRVCSTNRFVIQKFNNIVIFSSKS